MPPRASVLPRPGWLGVRHRSSSVRSSGVCRRGSWRQRRGCRRTLQAKTLCRMPTRGSPRSLLHAEATRSPHRVTGIETSARPYKVAAGRHVRRSQESAIAIVPPRRRVDKTDLVLPHPCFAADDDQRQIAVNLEESFDQSPQILFRLNRSAAFATSWQLRSAATSKATGSARPPRLLAKNAPQSPISRGLK